jgi:hypothetical protein
MSSAEESAGIQVIDVLLWLFARVYDRKPLPTECIKLMQDVLKMAGTYELSMESITESMTDLSSQIMSAPISAEQMERSQELLRLIEERRQDNMRQYPEEKLLANSPKSLMVLN